MTPSKWRSGSAPQQVVAVAVNALLTCGFPVGTRVGLARSWANEAVAGSYQPQIGLCTAVIGAPGQGRLILDGSIPVGPFVSCVAVAGACGGLGQIIAAMEPQQAVVVIRRLTRSDPVR